MRRNLSHIIAAAFNEPLLLEPAYARVFFCALGREMGAASLSVPQQQVQLDAPGMLAETDEYMAGGKRPARVYRVVNGIAVLPVSEGVVASSRYPKHWLTVGDPAREFTMTQSAPLMVLPDPDEFVVVQVK
ncbi:major capsid protein [Escherichia coli]|nr:hypothetical protein [Escherichia coli]